MKRAVFIIALAFLLALPAGAQETSGDFTAGSIKIGYDNRTCSAGLEGSIRYNSGGGSNPSFEVCSALNWISWGG